MIKNYNQTFFERLKESKFKQHSALRSGGILKNKCST